MIIMAKIKKHKKIILVVSLLLITSSLFGCVRKGRHGTRPYYFGPAIGSQQIYDHKKVRFISASELDLEEFMVDNYLIEMGDILEISVWQIEELHREVIVRPDGKISFPLIGDVVARGRTIEELRQDIVEKIKLYIKTPQVSVNILEFGGKKAVILGEIFGAGVIRFNSPTTIIEAVGLAGDFTKDANLDRVFIIRDAFEDRPTIILVNANSILKEANLRENIFIRSGDILYIPRSFIGDFKYFMINIFGPVVGYAERYYGDTWKRKTGEEWEHLSDQ
jgi:polysaccharide export outer membrane protein